MRPIFAGMGIFLWLTGLGLSGCATSPTQQGRIGNLEYALVEMRDRQDRQFRGQKRFAAGQFHQGQAKGGQGVKGRFQAVGRGTLGGVDGVAPRAGQIAA